MGAEPFLNNRNHNHNNNEATAPPPPPLVLGLQPAALIDHVARVDWSLLDQVPGDRGGSLPVAIDELELILSRVKTHINGSPNEQLAIKSDVKSHFQMSPEDQLVMKMLAGGSIANTVRGLSAGFGVSCGIIGAYGDNEQGQLFVSNMTSNGVNLSRLRMKNGPTGQCVCLVDELGNRTMRPCLSNAVKVQVPCFSFFLFCIHDEQLAIKSDVKSHFQMSPEDQLVMKMLAGGSIANTVRGLSAGFGVSCGIIGAYGDNEQGQLFVSNMTSNGVNLSRLRMKNGPTGQCVCLVDELGNRTMRPCLSNAVKVQWLLLRFGIFNVEVIQAAIKIAKQEGLSVSMDLASFEMVRNFKKPLLELLESGDIDLCFANEDEATELLRGEQNANPEVALEFLAKHCQWAVVTLGPNGCIAKHGKEIVQVPAIGESKAIDATGAGDLFASGFIYGLVKGLSLEECCKVGSCSGGSVIRSLGGEVTPENLQWMYKQMQVKGLPVPDIHK
ncbi:adenosine kinase 2 [Quercus suber]|uniref:Adenosine kinase 2 n=1 Tax=Quercus suber TaxID=58331 RepID=A0AAW0KVD8_QUESU